MSDPQVYKATPMSWERKCGTLSNTEDSWAKVLVTKASWTEFKLRKPHDKRENQLLERVLWCPLHTCTHTTKSINIKQVWILGRGSWKLLVLVSKLRSYAKTAAEAPQRAQGAVRRRNLGAVSSVCSLHPFLPPRFRWESAWGKSQRTKDESTDTQCPGHWGHHGAMAPSRFPWQWRVSAGVNQDVLRCQLLGTHPLLTRMKSYPTDISLFKGFVLFVPLWHIPTQHPNDVCVWISSNLVWNQSPGINAPQCSEAPGLGVTDKLRYAHHAVPEGSGTEVQHEARLQDQAGQKGNQGFWVLGFLRRGKLSHSQNISPGKLTKKKEE